MNFSMNNSCYLSFYFQLLFFFKYLNWITNLMLSSFQSVWFCCLLCFPFNHYSWEFNTVKNVINNKSIFNDSLAHYLFIFHILSGNMCLFVLLSIFCYKKEMILRALNNFSVSLMQTYSLFNLFLIVHVSYF